MRFSDFQTDITAGNAKPYTRNYVHTFDESDRQRTNVITVKTSEMELAIEAGLCHNSGMTSAITLSPQQIREQLKKILTSTTLKAVPLQREILKYVVDCELSGQPAPMIDTDLSGYAITKALFPRPDGTCPEDNYLRVRIEVGRLRKSLAEYYLVESALDETVITIPKGGYRADFTQKKRGQQLPTTFGPYTIEKACAADIQWAAAFAKEVYEGDDVISAKVMLAWHGANPNGFSLIKSDGEAIGNIDVLPVKPDRLSLFENGHCLERDIAAADIYSPSESSQIRDLYVESLVCNNSIAVAVVLSQFDSLVKRICNPKQVRRILAIAASPDGQNLLRKLGFEVAGVAQGHSLFVGPYSQVSKNLETVAWTLCGEFERRALRKSTSGRKPSGL